MYEISININLIKITEELPHVLQTKIWNINDCCCNLITVSPHYLQSPEVHPGYLYFPVDPLDLPSR